MKIYRKILFIINLLLLFCIELSGQKVVIFGKIVDSNTGEHLNNVSLSLWHKGAPIQQKTITGTYSFEIEQAGYYKLIAERAEYDKFTYDSVLIKTGDSIRRDIALERPPKFLCIINVNGQDCEDILKEVDHSKLGNFFRFAIFNPSPIPMKWVVSSNREWISVSSSENDASSGTIDSEGKGVMKVIIDPEKFEAGKTTGKILVISNNGNTVLSVKAVGKFPEITTLPPKQDFADNDYFPNAFKAEIQKFNGKHTYTEMGFCFSDINPIPTINDSHVQANDIGNFSYKDYWSDSHNFPWLEGGLENWEQFACRTYYVRAYLKYENENNVIIYSSNVEKFTLWEILCP